MVARAFDPLPYMSAPEENVFQPVPPEVSGSAVVREREFAVMEEVAVRVEVRMSPPLKTAEPLIESVRYGEEVPIPSLPEKNAICAVGSNQYFALVVEVFPIAMMSEELLE